MRKPDPVLIILFLCSTQLSLKFILLINVKMVVAHKCYNANHFNIYQQDKLELFYYKKQMSPPFLLSEISKCP